MQFLKALQEDTGNIFSYLVSMNRVNGSGWGKAMRGWGAIYPRVKCPPPEPQPLCMLSFLCDDQKD